MIWFIIAGMTAVTFVLRYSFIGLANRWSLPAVVQQALQFVPVAVLTAIVLPDLVYVHGTYTLALGNGRIVAALVATLVAWRTRNVVLTIAVGMATLFAVQALAGAI